MEDKKNGWHKFNMDMSELTAYENLSNAVIEQAVADMADAIMKIEMARRQERKYENQFLETSRFFQGELIRNLTEVDPTLLRQVAAKQGNYMIWKHDKGCSKCKWARNKKCIHGKGGVANWYAWSRGDHTCYRQLHDENRPDYDSLPTLDY